MYKLTIYQNFDPIQRLVFVANTPKGLQTKLTGYLKRVRYPAATCDGWTIGDAKLLKPGDDYADAHWWRASMAYNESYEDWTLEVVHAPHFDNQPYYREDISLDTYEETIAKFIELAIEYSVATFQR